MKRIFVFCLLLIPVVAQSQDFVKAHITPAGDTITKQSRIKILPLQGYHYIIPSGATQASLRTIYTNYLNVSMAGKVYNIETLKRYGKKKVVATIIVRDKSLNRHAGVEYVISVDDAVRSQEIEIVKP